MNESNEWHIYLIKTGSAARTKNKLPDKISQQTLYTYTYLLLFFLRSLDENFLTVYTQIWGPTEMRRKTRIGSNLKFKTEIKVDVRNSSDG